MVLSRHAAKQRRFEERLSMLFMKFREILSKNKIIVIHCFLAIATAAAFSHVTRCEFINFDDPQYVVENTHVQRGITMEGIRWAFTTGHAGNWHPLTWLSLMIDAQFFGLNPQGYHLINLIFHIANTLLLFFILNRLSKALWKSAFVAALFALHPLHVESVAWVAERKDVLSTSFWMLTMAAYTYYVEHPRLRTYLPVFACFALGLMTKPMLVTLPFVLLLLDYWPLQRLGRKNAAHEMVADADKQTTSSRQTSFFSIVTSVQLVEKLPLIALAAVSSAVTFAVQQRESLVVSFGRLPLSDRIGNALVSYVTYIEKAIWPHNLAFYYPYHTWASWQILAAFLFLISVTSVSIWSVKRCRYLAAGWLWYLGTLVPVIGLVQVGSQVRADRYTYIPLIGIFIMTVWGLPELLNKWRYGKQILIGLSALSFSCFFAVTWIQTAYWRNSLTLFDHTLEVTNNNYIAFNHRAVAHAATGNYKLAIADFDKAIAINPEYGYAYFGRGAAEHKLGNTYEAISNYGRALKLIPRFAAAYYYRGNAYSALERYHEAIADYDRAIDLEPNAQEFCVRGFAYAALGQYRLAIEDYNSAIRLQPDRSVLYANRGFARAGLGDYQEAINDYDRSLLLQENDAPRAAYTAETLNYRGLAYAALGKQRLAIEDYNRAIEINPKFPEAYFNRAASYGSIGNTIRTYENLNAAAKLGHEEAKDILKNHRADWWQESKD
jgi:tetratricopeptide (TPR) repeat protein